SHVTPSICEMNRLNPAADRGMPGEARLHSGRHMRFGNVVLIPGHHCCPELHGAHDGLAATSGPLTQPANRAKSESSTSASPSSRAAWQYRSFCGTLTPLKQT